MSYGSGLHLSAEVSSDTATCPVALCGPWASSIKKSLACLPVQLGTYVPNVCMHVFKAPNIKAIMCLQDV
jgi:hypothetical protein